MTHLAKLAALDAERTQGEWRAQGCVSGVHLLIRGKRDLPGAHPQHMIQVVPEEDAAWIAACSTAVPKLLEIARVAEDAKRALAAALLLIVRGGLSAEYEKALDDGDIPKHVGARLVKALAALARGQAKEERHA